MVGFNFEMALDSSKINGDFPRGGQPYVAKIKTVSFKDKDAFAAGKRIDGSMTREIAINITQDEDLMALFQQAFGKLLARAALQEGATVEEVVFDDEPPVKDEGEDVPE